MTEAPISADEETRKHNSAARAGRIQEYFRSRAALEAERDALSQQIRELGQKIIKGELGFKLADVNAAYRMYLLEDKDRDQLIDTLRETFDALGHGEQLDFIKALRTTKTPAAAAATAEPGTPASNGEASTFTEDARPDQGPTALANAYERGRKAADNNHNLDACPHTGQHEKKLKGSWEKGYMDVQEERARNLAPKPPEPSRPTP